MDKAFFPTGAWKRVVTGLMVLFAAAIGVAPARATGILTILHSFTGKADGSNPVGGVVRDAAGAVYGETFQGGGVACATKYKAGAQCGTVYSLDTAGNFKVLATFFRPEWRAWQHDAPADRHHIVWNDPFRRRG